MRIFEEKRKFGNLSSRISVLLSEKSEEMESKLDDDKYISS